MGLDMYLYGSRFISSYDPLPEESVLVESVREGMDLPDCENPLSTFGIAQDLVNELVEEERLCSSPD